MKSFRSKPVGWRGESQRHYLAAKGIKTRHKYYAYAPTYTGADLGPIAVDAMGTTGAAVVPWIPVIVPLALLYGGAKYVKKRKDKTGSYFAKQDELSDEAELRQGIEDDVDILSAFEGVRSGLPLATQIQYEKGLQKKRDRLDNEVLSLAALEKKRENDDEFFSSKTEVGERVAQKLNEWQEYMARSGADNELIKSASDEYMRRANEGDVSVEQDIDADVEHLKNAEKVGVGYYSPKSEEFEAFEEAKGEDMTLEDAFALFAKKHKSPDEMTDEELSEVVRRSNAYELYDMELKDDPDVHGAYTEELAFREHPEEQERMTEKEHGAMMQGFAKRSFSELAQEDKAKVMDLLNVRFKQGGETLANSDDTAQEILEFSMLPKVMERTKKALEERKAAGENHISNIVKDE
jgi:hypothetical protein